MTYPKGVTKEKVDAVQGVSKVAEPVPAVEAPQAPLRNLFSGEMPRLAVYGKPGTDPNNPIPGFKLRWFNDVEGGQRVTRARMSGWEFVSKDEVALNEAPTSPGNTDVGDKVSMWVMQGNNGSAINAYLMKIPLALWQSYQDEHEKVHVRVEERLKGGALGDGQYAGGTQKGSLLPPIKITSGLSR